MSPSTLLTIITLLTVIKFIISNTTSFPSLTSKLIIPLLNNNSLAQQLTTVDNEINSLKKQQVSISPQDQYAKWTKLNRQLDKLLVKRQEILDKNDALLTNYKKMFNNLNLMLLTLPLFALRIWYSKISLFYLPNDTFPNIILYILSLPRGKIGALTSVQWLFFLNLLLNNLYFVYSTLIAPYPSNPDDKIKEVPTESSEDTT